jgi:deoxyribodipyrimidine photo-lyase
MGASPSIVWLRQDLRIADNPALDAAARSGQPLLFLYVLDDETPGRWSMGGASRWWLHHSLEALGKEIAKRGSSLVLRRGRADSVVASLVAETSARAVYWNRCYEPYAVSRDIQLKRSLTDKGVDVETFNGALLFEPWTIKTKTGEPFKVFTPFWRACLAQTPRAVAPAPKRFQGYAPGVRSDALDSWRLSPARPNWAARFPWCPGEAPAQKTLSVFVDEKLSAYPTSRDILGIHATSQLSPHLHFGEISPVQVRAAVGDARGVDKYMQEIGWREFSTNLLYHWPTLPEANWKGLFDRFPWRDDAEALDAWRHGRTGYPVVDAAMRELWATGYMHNRARMIAASFLTKHLLIDWRKGEDWFWDTLVDADLANNAASWQWVAGSGADASPYFRIFNPTAQGQRYDPDGVYVKRWLPELRSLPNAFVHKPWTADASVLADAGVSLGKTYPFPIVDHLEARNRALAARAALD